MRMDIYSETPKSFKIDRKSPFASNLMTLISDKLRCFLGNNTDDVLAEYITVLVCNGKSQNQARDDLEAFLGKSSGDFVSWLWSLLLKSENQLSKYSASSRCKDGSTVSSHDSDMANNCSYTTKGNTCVQRTCKMDSSEVKCEIDPSQITHTVEKFGYLPLENNHFLQAGEKQNSPTVSAQKVSQSERDLLSNTHAASPIGDHIPKRSYPNTHAASPLGDHIPKRPCPNTHAPSPLGDHIHKRPCPNTHDASLIEDHFPKRPCPKTHVASPMRDHIPKRPCPMLPETSYCRQQAATGSDNPVAMTSASCENTRPHRSVWDRLGKPPEGAQSSCEEISNHSLSVVRISSKKHTEFVEEVNILGEEDSGNAIIEGKGVGQDVSTVSGFPAISHIQSKRYVGEVSSGPKVGSQVCNRSISKVEYPQKQLQDMKLQVRQMEMHMSKLRSKALEIENDRKTTPISTSGIVKPTGEDIESRTVLVTNVHLEATKESIFTYFARCGVVADIVFLEERASPYAERSVYVTFASEESANKARAWSGSSFYSKTIMVLKKGGKADMTSESVQHNKKRLQPQSSFVDKNSAVGRPSRRHLQWKRGSTSTAPSVPLESTDIQKKGVNASANRQFP